MQGKINVVAISLGFVFCSFTKTWIFPSLFAVLSQFRLKQPANSLVHGLNYHFIKHNCRDLFYNKEQVAEVVTKENNTRFT